MSIDLSLLVWTIINFFILMFLLNRLLFKPIMKFINERQERIDSAIAAGEKTKATIAEDERKLRAEMEEYTRSEKLRTATAIEDAKKEMARALEEAEAEAQVKREAEIEKINREEEFLESKLTVSLPRITSALAEKLIEVA